MEFNGFLRFSSIFQFFSNFGIDQKCCPKCQNTMFKSNYQVELKQNYIKNPTGICIFFSNDYLFFNFLKKCQKLQNFLQKVILLTGAIQPENLRFPSKLLFKLLQRAVKEELYESLFISNALVREKSCRNHQFLVEFEGFLRFSSIFQFC